MLMTKGFTVGVALLSVAAFTACDGRGKECGPGTVADGARCVPSCDEGQRWDNETESCESVCADGTTWNGTRRSCEPDTDCGAGTHEVGGECVPDDIECAPGTVWDDEADSCVAECVRGTSRDEETGACVPESAACVSGQVWDPEAGDCVDVADYCAEGTTWVASEGRCVPNDDLLVADQMEGTAENDPTYGGADAYEELTLPAVGETYVIGGAIGAPEDKDGDGSLDPDMDFWVFSVAGPTLVRLSADGVGGASSGFAVAAVGGDLDYQRFGIGSTMDGAVRDVYLPRAGVYAILASDAMNFLSSSAPFFGGEGFGYFITIEPLPAPTPEALAFADGAATTTSQWPVSPPSTGSMLGFYSVEVDVEADAAGALVGFELSTASGELTPVAMVFDSTGTLLFQADAPRPWGVASDSTFVVVADYEYFFAVRDTEYDLSVRDHGLGTVDGALERTTVDQPEWTIDEGRDFPWTYFGFTATEGDVVTLLATTSTGVTYFEVTSADFAASFGSFQGADAAPVYDGEIRFYAPYTGLYVVSTLGVMDLEGFLWIERIPEQSFEMSLAVLEQTPATITPPETFDAATVDERAYERFFALDPPVGGSFWIDVAGEPGLDPLASLYAIGEPGPLVGVASPDLSFPVRFPDGAPLLLGVADDTREAGAFDLDVAPLTIEDLGAVAEAAPVEVRDHAMAAGTTRAFFQVRAEAAGLATITVTPASFDAAVVARDATLAEIGAADSGSEGLAETIELPVSAAAPAFFEVRTTGGAPLAAPAAVDVDVVLTPFTVEVEPNDGPSAALAVTPPDVIVGEVAAGGDRDWYSVTVTGPSRLTAETMPLLTGDPTDTVLRLYGTDGVTELAFDDDGGEGTWSRIAYGLPSAGTYFIEVGGYGDVVTGDYLLVVDTRLMVFQETFDSEIPASWTVTDHDSDGESWMWCNGSATGSGCVANDTGSASGGGMAIMNSDYAGQADDSLQTPAIDCSALTRVVLELDHDFNEYSASDDRAVVQVSVDGTAWDEVAAFAGVDVIGHEVLDVSSFAAGQPAVYFRFYYTADWDFYWMIDDVTVTGS